MSSKPHSGDKDSSSFLLAVIILLLAGGIGVGIYSLRISNVDQALSEDRVISALFVFEKDEKPLCSYVLLCYPQTRRTAVFDIPGNVGMMFRQINRFDRIDTVYTPQRISPYQRAVESLLGIEISYSVVFDIENLGKTVDLIGGVDIFIPSKIDIRDSETLVLLPSGVNRLDGNKIIDYMEYESPEEDPELAVFRRQRFFLGFLKRLAETDHMFNSKAVSRMFQSYMQTNLNQRTRIRLFNEIARMDMERINIQSVGGNNRVISGNQLLIPFYDGNLVKDIVRQVLGTLTRPADGLTGDRVFTVEVLNGTAINGLAGRTAEILRGFGYDIISTGNADNSNYARTLIIDRSGNEDIGSNFAGIIRCNNINYETPPRDTPEGFALQSHELRSDFTLILGRDFNGRYVTGN